MTKQTYRVGGMHCASCALMIESDLEDVGVKAHCHYGKETLEVEYDETKVNEEKIAAIVQKSGYTLLTGQKH